MQGIIPSYPLQWPQGVPRTPPGRRERSPFRTDFPKAVANVVSSLRGFQKDSDIRIDHPVISSNLDVMGRLYGDDPGVAAWFMFDGQWVCFGVDRFPVAEANVQAIHHIIEARRTELRYGGLSIIRQTFRSFAALPAPQAARWWEVLGVSHAATREQIEDAWRRLARLHHPDAGGSPETMARINAARDQALQEVKQ